MNKTIIDKFEDLVDNTAQYPSRLECNKEALSYVILGLTGEAGEITNKFKKVIRGDKDIDIVFKKAITKEIGDVMWYVQALCDELSISLPEVMEENISKLEKRLVNGTIKGDGDNR